MTRDRDEWRRPWTEGEVAPPTSVPIEPAAGVATSAPDASFASSPAPDVYDVDATSPAADPLVAPSAAASPYPTLPPPSSVVAAPSHPAPLPAPARDRKDRPRRGGVLAGVLGGVVGALLTVVVLAGVGVLDAGVLTGGDDAAPSGTGASDVTSTPAPALTPDPLPEPGESSGIPDVADRVLPSVVRINTSGAVDITGAGALGSGVIYRPDGYIITNHHVIEGASAVEVLLANGDRYEAEIVGSDELNDLAVLRIDRDGLPAIALRPVDEPLRVGETVVAIGSPFGLDATVTAGIISALNRDLTVPNSADVIPAVIQTDAAINPGNSGGALVDLRGRLVGINTAIVSRSGANEGVGFAVPVRQAVVSGDQLIEQGFVRYPLLGITGTDITAEVAEAFDLPNRRGAVVDTVQEGSGADAGGMRAGDVIVAVDGLPLASMSDLVAEVRRRAPGDTVVFDVLRDGERVQLEAVLGERPRS